jgi:trigger factor
MFEENVIQAVAANAQVDVPHEMIHQEMDRMFDEQSNQMRYQGFEMEQYLSYMGQTAEGFKDQLHEPAEQRIRTRLVLEAIAKAENVTATEEEITAEIETMASQYGMSAEDLKARLPSDDENNFVADAVVHRKTVAMLVEKAVPVAPPPEPEKTEDAATDAEADSPAEAESTT